MLKMSVLVLLAFWFASASGVAVELSVDHGKTWRAYTNPLEKPPISALLRVHGGSPIVTLPACALEASLLIQVWKDAESHKPIGMRWRSRRCQPTDSVNVEGVVIQTIVPKSRTPEWIPYLHDQKVQERSQNPRPERKSWWRRYSLYVMLFFVVALGQGIRQGLAEQRMEIEREEEERKRKKRSGPGQMRVVVPKRKETKVRRRSVNIGLASS